MELVTQLNEDVKARLEELFARHERIDIAIESILQGQQGGNIKLWVDQMNNPRICKLQQGSFIRLAGEPEEKMETSTFIKSLKPPFFIQPCPLKWLSLLEKEFSLNLKKTRRFKFSDAHLSKSHLNAIIQKSPWKGAVKKLKVSDARKLSEDEWGKYHFLNYAQPEDLIAKGMAYGIEIEGEIVSCCSSALFSKTAYEVNIITKPAYRNQGMAKAVAAQFIGEGLEKSMEPHWDAANEFSKRLALALGYECIGVYDLHYVM